MPVPLFAPRRAQVAGGPGEMPALPAPRGPMAIASSPPSPRLAHGYAREAAALVLLATALFVALALASFRADPLRQEVAGADWVGPAGAFVARAGVDAVGLAAWFFPIELALLAAPLLNGRRSLAGVT